MPRFQGVPNQDLLALQIREQATFDAQVLEVDALNEYFRAQAKYRARRGAVVSRPISAWAATAIDTPKVVPQPQLKTLAVKRGLQPQENCKA